MKYGRIKFLKLLSKYNNYNTRISNLCKLWLSSHKRVNSQSVSQQYKNDFPRLSSIWNEFRMNLELNIQSTGSFLLKG